VIRPVRTIPGEFRSATLSPDGRRVALYARSTIRIVDLQTAGEQTHAYRWGSWSPDGSKFVALDNTNAIWWLDPSSGATTQIPGPPAYTSRVVTDGARVWASKRDDTAAHDEGSPWRMITELTTKYEQRFPAPVGILAPYLHGRIASTSATMTTISETLQGQIRGRRVRIDPDSIFASDNAITISDGTSAIIQLRGQMQIHTLATDRAGRIASADQDGTIRIWRPPFVTRRHGDGKSTTSAATLTADRRELVMTRLGPALEVQTLDTGALRRIDVTAFPDGFTPTTYEWAERITQVGNMRFSERTEGNNDEILVLVGSASGRKLASIDERQHLMVWDLDASTGRMLAEGALHVAISSDGSRVVSAHQDRTLKVWELSTNKPVQLGSSMQVSALAFGPDRAIAVATLGGNIYTFDARHKARKIAEQGEVNRALAYTPDGKTLVAGGDRWYLRTWQLDTLATRKLIGHSGTVTALTVADDGRVASTSADLTVRVWNLATGSSSVLRGHTGLVTSVVFGADDMLVTASEDRTARVWDLRSRESRSLTGHADTVLFASHLPGEQQLLVVDRFRQIAVYPDNLPHDEMLLRLWLETATNLTN
jgi:WD40 repeat protein